MDRMRRKTVFADQGLTVSVAESMEFRVDRTERMRLATGALKPVAVIVNGPEGPRAFGMDGLPVDIDQIEFLGSE